jgi:hypothetical protein
MKIPVPATRSARLTLLVDDKEQAYYLLALWVRETTEQNGERLVVKVEGKTSDEAQAASPVEAS